MGYRHAEADCNFAAPKDEKHDAPLSPHCCHAVLIATQGGLPLLLPRPRYATDWLI